MFYADILLQYYGINTQNLTDYEFGLAFWTLLDIRKKEAQANQFSNRRGL